MAKIDISQVSFAGGEQSPLVGGRTDISKYPIGCRELTNFIVLLQGGLARRTGTRHVAEAKVNTGATRLIRFAFSTTQNYQLEFSNLAIRFYSDNGRVETSPGVAYELVSPYPSAAIDDIRYVQSADVLYLFHPDYEPRKLIRAGALSWSLALLATQDGPTLDINTTGTTLTCSAASGSITVTASTGIFASTDVRRVIRIKSGANWGWVRITAYTNATTVTASVGSTVGTAATTSWALGVYSTRTGWPRCGAFYEDRLWLGGNYDYPQTLTASTAGGYEVFSPTDTAGVVTADNGLSYTISTDDVNSIVNMSPGKVLSVFTTAAEFSVSASNLNEAITPTNIKISRDTTRGSKKTTPVRVDNSVLHVQRSGRKIREYGYSFQDDAFISTDITILAEHITKGVVKEMAYQQEPYSIIWTTTEDGKLIALSYNREQDMVAWHQQPLGGEDVSVISVSETLSSNTYYNEIWLVVDRTINGTTKRYVEYLTEEIDPVDENDKSRYCFLDSSLVYSGSPVTTISGLDHLEGQTVGILADGAVQPDKVVTGGEIELTIEASDVVVGLNYTSRVVTNSLEAGGNFGTSQGKVGRINRLDLLFHNTIGCNYGPDVNNLVPLSFRATSDPMDSSPPLFSGYQDVVFDAHYEDDKTVVVEQSQPYPCTILAIVPSMVVYG
jgi:hypothetical protein